MSDTTSADTTRLNGFLMSVGVARTSLWNERSSVAGELAGVIANCDNPVDVPAVASLLTLLDDMKANQTFVTTVRDALLAADHHGEGNPTIANADVETGLTAAGVGNPPEQIEVDPVTLVGIPPTSGYVDDPICAANGNMIHQETDLIFPVIAGALNIVRTYNSLVSERVGAFGPGWSSVLDMRVDAVAADAAVTLGDGAAIPFVRQRDVWVSTGRREVDLVEHEDGWTLKVDTVRSFEFSTDGDLTGWHVGVARVAVVRGELDRIVRLDESVTGRSVTVDWNDGVVSEIVADDGRAVSYQRDSDARIERATSHAGWVDYEWDGDLLRSVIDADGVPLFVNQYDEQRRVSRQVSQQGRITTYRYNESGSTVITGERDAVRQAMIHDRRGNLTAVIDIDGSAMRFTYDTFDRVTKVVERDGAEWAYVYDERGDLIRRVDPDGAMVRWQWDDQRRLVAETDRAGMTTSMEFDTDFRSPTRVISPDGSVASQVLDERGLPLTMTDADGVVTHFEWDRDGQMVATTDGAGRTTTFEYDERSLLTKLVKPANCTTLLERDHAGRVTRKTDGEAASSHTYTPAGRMIGGSEPGELAWTATFDPGGQMASMTDESGSTVTFTHDDLGNVTSVTAPDGAAYTNTYSPVGLHLTASDPTGATVTKGYDRRGRLTEFVDAEGNTWTRELDIVGRTVSSTAPDGATTRWTYHPNGEVATVTLPDGRTWTTDVDALGRPIAVTNPAGGQASIEYTPGGRPLRRVSPAGRVESFEYDDAGRLSVLTGIDGQRRFFERDDRGYVTAVTDGRARRLFDWDDDYRLLATGTGTGGSRVRRDAGGRVIESIDSTGSSTQFAYDTQGRLSRAIDPAGLVSEYGYDDRGRLKQQVTPGERQMAFEYGDDGRLARISDPSGVVTDCLRNANGAVTGLRHGDGTGWDRELDHMGRETSRTATDGMVLAEYGYDNSGRMTSSVVPGTDLFTEFLWDDSDRLVETSTLDGGTVIERDADGWVVASTNPEGRRLEFERDPLGRISSVRFDGDDLELPSSGGVVRDLAGRLTVGSDGTLYRYDDAGRIAEIAPGGRGSTLFNYTADGLVDTEIGPGGSRRFSYDDAGRVVGITVDGQGSTSIQYDQAGRRVREVGPAGEITMYVWDAAGRLTSIGRDGPTSGRISISYDAANRPAFVDGDRVRHDPLSGRAERIGDDEFFTLGADRYDFQTETWTRPNDATPFGGVPAGPVFIVGARVLDPLTHQFLSPDPLLAVAGSNGAASAYTYAWHDPINKVDPSGLRPISIEEADAMRTREEQGRVGQFVEAIKNDPWGTLAMVGVVAVGVGLLFVPGGQAIGAGILISTATSAGVGFATGTFSPTGTAVAGAFGAIPGGSTFAGAVVVGAASGAGETIATSVLTGEGFPPAGSIFMSAATGGVGGGAANRLSNMNPSTSTANLDHTPTAAPPSGARFVVDSNGTAVDLDGPIVGPGLGTPFDGTVYRNTPAQYADDAWNSNPYSTASNHRYTPEGQPGTYAATSESTIAAEMGRYGVDPMDPTRVTVSRDVHMDNVLDLTDPATRAEINIGLDDITADSYEATSSIGLQAASEGYDGIVAPSARGGDGVNVVAFDGF